LNAKRQTTIASEFYRVRCPGTKLLASEEYIPAKTMASSSLIFSKAALAAFGDSGLENQAGSYLINP
jgi:hypothetical protein